MAKADRLARLDERRIELEEEYRVALIDALRATAAGRRGLFEHNQDKTARAATSPIIEALGEIGDAIDGIRDQFGMSAFELQKEFLSARGPVGPSAVGEPKQAQAWLDRLGASDPAKG